MCIVDRSRLLIFGALVVAIGCSPPKEPVKAAPQTAPPATTSEPVAKTEAPPPDNGSLTHRPVQAAIAPDVYTLGRPLTGRIVGIKDDGANGTLTLAMCSASEWQRAVHERRPPIEVETTTVDLDRPEGERFIFNSTADIVGGLMIYPFDRNAKTRVLPVEVRPREGGPLDNAGPIDGVGTTGMGAPTDAHNPALRSR